MGAVEERVRTLWGMLEPGIIRGVDHLPWRENHILRMFPNVTPGASNALEISEEVRLKEAEGDGA